MCFLLLSQQWTRVIYIFFSFVDGPMSYLYFINWKSYFENELQCYLSSNNPLPSLYKYTVLSKNLMNKMQIQTFIIWIRQTPFYNNFEYYIT